MKRILFGLLLAGLVSFYACEQESLLLQSDELIEQIAASAQKTDVTGALPAGIVSYLETNYAPLSVENAWKVRNMGYEVMMENNSFLYFNQNQECLGGGGGPGGFGGPHPPHPRGCMRGDTIDVALLPAAILDHVTANYPDETIAVAVQKLSGKYAIELSDGTMMIFDEEGVFITLCGECAGGPPPPHPGCMAGVAVDPGDLLPAILDFITITYPDLTIQAAVVKPLGAFAVELSDGTVLLFNPEGVFFRECGNCTPPQGGGHHGGPHGGGNP